MLLFKRSFRRYCREHGRACSVRERHAFDAGRRFRMRHGPAPYWLDPDRSSDDWNGDAPYAKHLRIPSRLGLVKLRWAKRQRWREAWELGWAFQDGLNGGAR
jgi:hypothetical protein